MRTKVLYILLVAFLATIFVITKADSCENIEFYRVSHHNGPLSASDTEVELNISIHKDSVWSAKLWRLKYNYTEMLLTWNLPANSSNKLCAFTLFYYRGNNTVRVTQTVRKHFRVNIFPNATEYLVTGLEFGTSYHMYLEAVFENNVAGTKTKTLKSWILIAMTNGVGPDNPCNCMAINTVNKSSHICDQHSGQCPCDKPFSVFGRRCDHCAPGHYFNPHEGCTACDKCPKDPNISNGSCHWVEGDKGMQCECNTSYSGHHCEMCNFGHYLSDGYCVPCDCSGNEKPDVQDFCNNQTGRCKACVDHIAGDRCELCAPGYVGNAVIRSCRPQSTVVHDVGIAILSIIIIVIIVAAGVIVFRRYARRQRRMNFMTSLKGSLGSHSAVNFATMMEEPEMEFPHHDRQLEIFGSRPVES